jgi:hypothetical protein
LIQVRVLAAGPQQQRNVKGENTSMYDTIWDRLAAWLAEYTALQQLGIMAGAVLAIITVLLWVTI